MTIVHDPARGFVALSTDATTYAFAADEDGFLRHLYWGPRVDDPATLTVETLWPWSTNDLLADVTPQEYPVHGGFRSGETCLTVQFADGSTELRPEVAGIQADADSVVVQLVDTRGVTIDLHYRVPADLDVIERRAVITNVGDSPIVLTEAASAAVVLPARDLELRNVAGFWGAEQQAFTTPVGPAKLVLEARRGISTHHHNPYVVLADAGAGEDHGEVWGAALAWSGNFRAAVEQTPYGFTTAVLGTNPWQSAITLAPGATHTTPRVILTRSDGGLAPLSHRFHAYGRSLMDPRSRPVLYNSWEATEFAVDVAGQRELAGLAARVGAELFVLDDGWFGRRDTTDDGLGDWWPSRKKFPDGLGALISEVRALGMQFGLWVEPEMVNPASDLYADHPDWIYRDPLREPDTARGQYVLNLALPEVSDYLFEVLDGLLADHDIAYLKWDANRPMSAVGARPDAYRAHIAALYALVGRLKEAHPGVLVEASASGGGRVDFGALDVFDDFWTSDNTDAVDRLDIQRAYSLVYPVKAMRAWITDVPNFLTGRSVPLAFRARSAMLGTLGLGLDLRKCSDDELDALARQVADYQRLRPLITEGDFYRLPDDGDARFFAAVAPDGDRAVLFAFGLSRRLGRRAHRVRLRGLDPAATYRFRAGYVDRESTGAELMAVGLLLWLHGDYASDLIEFERRV